MNFILDYTDTAQGQLRRLKHTAHLEKCYKAVTKALKNLAQNSRHHGLQTHAYQSLAGPQGEKVFEAYAEQDTPAAYRIFFYYGAHRGEIVILAITPHP